MVEKPTTTEIQRATRIIEQEPEISAEEAIERARGITLLLPVPADLMPKLQAQGGFWLSKREYTLHDLAVASEELRKRKHNKKANS